VTAPCQLCRAVASFEVSKIDRHGKPLRTVLCQGCGVITNDPIPDDAELVAFYSTEYRTSYKGAAVPRMRQMFRNFGRLDHHIQANREFYRHRPNILDLGAGSGEFMFLAKAMGSNCIGVEPTIEYADYCRNMLDLNVLTQTLETSEFSDASFDHIRLSHVLEHMNDPVRSLKVLHRWLKPDGLLYIEVPNTETDANNKMRGRMFHFGHIFNFNPVTLRLAASLAGFEEVEGSRLRLSNTASGFFAPKTATLNFQQDLKANAERMMSLMAGHNSRFAPKPEDGNALTRFFKMTVLRMSELMAATKFADQRAIADHFAKHIAS
jgi:ubiquinone/menaquinone biosynthesis C-methylase UbiE